MASLSFWILLSLQILHVFTTPQENSEVNPTVSQSPNEDVQVASNDVNRKSEASAESDANLQTTIETQQPPVGETQVPQNEAPPQNENKIHSESLQMAVPQIVKPKLISGTFRLRANARGPVVIYMVRKGTTKSSTAGTTIKFVPKKLTLPPKAKKTAKVAAPAKKSTAKVGAGKVTIKGGATPLKKRLKAVSVKGPVKGPTTRKLGQRVTLKRAVITTKKKAAPTKKSTTKKKGAVKKTAGTVKWVLKTATDAGNSDAAPTNEKETEEDATTTTEKADEDSEPAEGATTGKTTSSTLDEPSDSTEGDTDSATHSTTTKKVENVSIEDVVDFDEETEATTKKAIPTQKTTAKTTTQRTTIKATTLKATPPTPPKFVPPIFNPALIQTPPPVVILATPAPWIPQVVVPIVTPPPAVFVPPPVVTVPPPQPVFIPPPPPVFAPPPPPVFVAQTPPPFRPPVLAPVAPPPAAFVPPAAPPVVKIPPPVVAAPPAPPVWRPGLPQFGVATTTTTVKTSPPTTTTEFATVDLDSLIDEIDSETTPKPSDDAAAFGGIDVGGVVGGFLGGFANAGAKEEQPVAAPVSRLE